MSLNAILEPRLRKIGLSKVRSKIYLAMLYVQKATIMDLSRMLSIPHPTILYNLRWMVEKKLVMWDTDEKRRGRKKYYYVVSPNQGLRHYFKSLFEDVINMQDIALEAIDGFQYLFRAGVETPEIKFFNGKEMLHELHEEVWNSKFEEAYEFVNLDESYKLAPPKKGDHRGKFKQLKKPWTCIYTHSQGAILPEKDGKGTNYNIPQKQFPFKGVIAIFGDKVVLSSDIKKLLGVLVRDKSIAETVRQLFRLALKGIHCILHHKDEQDVHLNQ